MSLHLNAGFNHREGELYLESINKYYNSFITGDSIQQLTDQLVDGYSYSANIAYTEPLGKKGQLQFNYSPSFNKSQSDQEVFKFDNQSNKYALFDSTQSNIFENTTTSQSGGAGYRVGDRDNMFSIGANYKYTVLNSDRLFPVVATVNKSFSNILPNLMWRKKYHLRRALISFTGPIIIHHL